MCTHPTVQLRKSTSLETYACHTEHGRWRLAVSGTHLTGDGSSLILPSRTTPDTRTLQYYYRQGRPRLFSMQRAAARW